MADLLEALRSSAPTAARVIEYLAVPRRFTRDEALKILQEHVTPNGYNPAVLDLLTRTGMLRWQDGYFAIADRTRLPALASLSPDTLSAVATAWQPQVRQRDADADATLDTAYLGLLAADENGAMSIREEFAKAESSHAVERQAFVASLVRHAAVRSLPRTARASMYYVLGMSEYRRGRTRQAMMYFEQAVETGARSQDVAIAGHLLANDYARRRERWRRAEALYEDSIQIGEDLANQLHVAQVEHSYANLLSRQRQRWDDAAKLYEHSIGIGEAIGNDVHVAKVKHGYANLLAHQPGRWADAEDLYRESIAIDEGLQRLAGVAQSKHSYANLLSRQPERWDRAEELYKDSIAIDGSLGNSVGVARSKHSYANLLSRIPNRWRQAETLYRESIRMGKAIGDRQQVARVEHSFANFLSRRRQGWAEAQVLYEDSLEILTDVGDWLGVAQVSFKYGEFLCRTRLDLRRGLSQLRRSLDLNVRMRTQFVRRVREAYERYSSS